ncbi:SDR family oxidoreductase [Mesorhizobium sp. M0965]
MGRDHPGEGVCVNLACRNEVEMPMLQTGFAVRGLEPNTAMANLNRSAPLGRAVRPEDIADGVLLLASEAARYMCGALVEVNGGKAVE